MPSGNDAPTLAMAKVNCAYCAVGGLFGKPASEILRTVYNLMGKTAPTGSRESDCGVDGFSELAFYKDSEEPTELVNHEPLAKQIEGIRYFLQRTGATTELFGSAESPLLFADAIRRMKGCAPMTRFLAVAGDADFGTYLTTLVHWTVGQKQEDGLHFFDHQLNVTTSSVGAGLKLELARRRINASTSETASSPEPLGPLGQTLDSDDKRCVIIVVRPG